MYQYVPYYQEFSYFIIAMVKHYDQGKLQKTGYNWALQIQRIKTKVAVGKYLDQQKRAQILNHKEVTERANLKRHKTFKS